MNRLLYLILVSTLYAMNSNSITIYTNAKIWTGVEDIPLQSVLVLNGDKIAAVGGEELLSNFNKSEAEIIDLKGAFVVPGFIDNHTHLMAGGFQLAQVKLRYAQDRDQFVETLKQFAEKVPSGRWITGGRWDHENWGGELPRKEWIDNAVGDHPVFVSRLDGHMGLANSIALKMAGISAETPDPDGGSIIKDDLTGEPTGILKDEAMTFVFDLIPDPSVEESDEAFDRAMEHILALGVTQVQDMSSWSDFETYLRAQKRGALRARIHTFIYDWDWELLKSQNDAIIKGDDWLSIAGVKLFVDGSLGSSTAWFYDPYLHDPSTSGLMVTDTAYTRQIIFEVEEAGLQMAIHAIGDRANDWALDAYADVVKKYGNRDRRFRIEHAQHLTQNALNRFAELGVIASMQPPHLIDDGRWAEKRIGNDVLAGTYAIRTLLDSGARVTFGSDWTVAPIAPLFGIYAAATRRTLDNKHPDGWLLEQKISVEEALRCYTANNAWGVFSEDSLGTIEQGKLADFVVLSQDLLDIDPVNIRDVNVLRTVVSGKEQYNSVAH